MSFLCSTLLYEDAEIFAAEFLVFYDLYVRVQTQIAKLAMRRSSFCADFDT